MKASYADVTYKNYTIRYKRKSPCHAEPATDNAVHADLREIQDWQDRKNSLVIYGIHTVPESEASTSETGGCMTEFNFKPFAVRVSTLMLTSKT